MQHYRTFVLALLLVFGYNRAFSQEFFADGSMELTKVASDPQYGKEADYAHSIKVGANENIVYFLNALRGPSGEKTRFARVGSCCPYDLKTGPDGIGLLAQWKVTYVGLASPVTLYFNKNVYEAPMCPAGFTFKTEKDIVLPVKFPADSIKKVNGCTKTAYAVDDFLLKEQAGAGLAPPDKSPEFEGGAEGLRQFIDGRQLSADVPKTMVFRASVSFLVTCEGKAGNFQVASKGRGDLETYANQVLAIVNRMPQRWQPAVKDGKPVDCYQIATFTVAKGSIFQVSVR